MSVESGECLAHFMGFQLPLSVIATARYCDPQPYFSVNFLNEMCLVVLTTGVHGDYVVWRLDKGQESSNK